MPPIVLLDLDGCLLDSAEPIRSSLNDALDAVGLEPVPAAEIRHLIGPPLADTVPRLLAGRGRPDVDPDDVIARYRSHYRARSIELTRTYPGTVAALDDLSTFATLGVVTSKPRRYAEPILDTLGLTDRFRVVEAPGGTEAEGKVTTLGRALERLQVAGSPQVVMVGDRRHDIEAGRAHGCVTVGVRWGFGDDHELTDAGADRLVSAPNELADVTASLTGFERGGAAPNR